MTNEGVYDSKLSRFILTITHYPKTFLAICFLIIIFLGLQLKNLETNPTTYVLNKSHPVRVIDSELSEIFTSTGATLSVMITPQSGEVFNSGVLNVVNDLTQNFENMNLSNEGDIEKLNTFAKDQTSTQLVDQALQDGLHPNDVRTIKELKVYLEEHSLVSGKDKGYLDDLAIYLNPIANVRSVTNVEDIRDEDDVLIIQDLVTDVSADDEILEALSKHVKNNPLLMNSVVSEDLQATIIRVELTVPNDYTAPVIRAYEYINEATKDIPVEYQINVGGSAVVFNEMSYIIKQDNARFFPFVLLVIIITLALCFKNVEGVYIPILVAVASLLCTLGLMPLFDLKKNMISSLTPIFVMASAVADSIHVLNHYYRNLSQHELTKQQAIQATIQSLFKPIFLTSITTICGFLSLAYTEVIFIREFGLMVATGIFFAFLFSIVMIPALLMLNKRPPVSAKKSILLRAIQSVVNRCNSAWQNHSRKIVSLMILAFAASTFYAVNVKVDYETISFYPEDSKLRIDDRAFKEQFEGIIPLTIRLDGDEAGALYSDEVVRYIEEVETVLKNHPDVGYVVSPNSYLKRLLQIIVEGDKDKLPDDLSEELSAQLFLLYDNSSGSEIRDVADNGYRDGRIIALVTTDMASVVRDIVNKALAVKAPDGIKVSIAGHASIVLAATDEIIYGQFNSLIITAFVVFVIMAILFRKFGMGLLAVTPLVLTILVNFGIMGYMKLDLNIATVIIAAIVFGIGIDYSIHLIEAAKLNFKQGLNKAASLTAAMKSTAEPILINSITLAAGFLVMTVSQLKPLYYLGNLISATMIISAFLTIILVPTLLNLLPISLEDKSGKKSKEAVNVDSENAV